MTVEAFIELVGSTKVVTGRDYVKLLCPAHPDDNPSLAVKAGDEGVLIKCHCGCSVEDICAALNITPAELFYEQRVSKSSDGKVFINYPYKDRNGNTVARKVRSVNPDGSKFFFWKSFTPEGVEVSGRGRNAPPYYHQDLIEREIAEGHAIWILNGEKAVDRARKEWGIKATCFPDGEGKNIPDEVYADLSRARDIVIVADIDSVGETSARGHATRFMGKGANVEIYQSATGNLKDDLFDHIEAGLALGDLVRRRDLEPPKGGIFATSAISAVGVEAKPVEWIFKPYVPRGAFSLFTGDPGIGKTLLMEYLAGVISRGEKDVFGSTGIKGKVLLYLSEDALEYVTVPRLQAFGVDLSMVTILTDAVPFDEAHLDQFEQYLEHERFIWVVIDPITTFIEAATKKSGPGAITAREIMSRLKQIAERTHTGITGLRHKRKANKDKDASAPAIYEGYGGIEVTGGARTEMHMKASSEFVAEGQCAVIEQVKNNLATVGPTQIFTTKITGYTDTQIEIFEGKIESGSDGGNAPVRVRTAQDKGKIARAIMSHNCTGKFAPRSTLEAAFKTNMLPPSELDLVLRALREEGWDVLEEKSGREVHYRVDAPSIF